MRGSCGLSRLLAITSLCRFSAKRKSHGWCDFAQSSVVLDPSTGFAISDTILVTADILVLSEQTQSVRENEVVSASSNATAEVLSGKFTWKVFFHTIDIPVSFVLDNATIQSGAFTSSCGSRPDNNNVLAISRRT